MNVKIKSETTPCGVTVDYVHDLSNDTVVYNNLAYQTFTKGINVKRSSWCADCIFKGTCDILAIEAAEIIEKYKLTDTRVSELANELNKVADEMNSLYDELSEVIAVYDKE